MSQANDIEGRSKKIGITPEAYINIIKIIIQERAKDIEDLEMYIEQENIDQIKVITHKLIGVFGNLRIKELFEPVRHIDRLIRSNGSFKEVNESFLELKSAFEELKNQFT